MNFAFVFRVFKGSSSYANDFAHASLIFHTCHTSLKSNSSPTHQKLKCTKNTATVVEMSGSSNEKASTNRRKMMKAGGQTETRP